MKVSKELQTGTISLEAQFSRKSNLKIHRDCVYQVNP